VKRNVARSQRLPAFTLDIPKLELLLSEAVALFPSPNARLTLTAYVGQDDWSFDSVEDLKANQAHLPNRITSLYLSLVGDGQILRLKTRLPYELEAEAVSDSDVWCAGALALFKRVAAESRQWYSFLRPGFFHRRDGFGLVTSRASTGAW
jgi:hypothetical protein